MERIEYDEFGLFPRECAEFGLPSTDRRRCGADFVEVGPGRKLSALVWGTESRPGAASWRGQNAAHLGYRAMALGRPVVAIDLPVTAIPMDRATDPRPAVGDGR